MHIFVYVCMYKFLVLFMGHTTCTVLACDSSREELWGSKPAPPLLGVIHHLPQTELNPGCQEMLRAAIKEIQQHKSGGQIEGFHMRFLSQTGLYVPKYLPVC